MGLLLMTGPKTTEKDFEPNIFSPQRIRLAPALCLVGYTLVLPFILLSGGDEEEESAEALHSPRPGIPHRRQAVV